MISYHTYYCTFEGTKVRKYFRKYLRWYMYVVLPYQHTQDYTYGYWHPNQSITYTKRFSLLDLVSLHFCSEFLCLCVILINPSTGVVGLIRSSSATA